MIHWFHINFYQYGKEKKFILMIIYKKVEIIGYFIKKGWTSSYQVNTFKRFHRKINRWKYFYFTGQLLIKIKNHQSESLIFPNKYYWKIKNKVNWQKTVYAFTFFQINFILTSSKTRLLITKQTFWSKVISIRTFFLLTQRMEKGLQESGTNFLHDTAIHFAAMIKPRLIQKIKDGTGTSTLGIFCTVDNSRNSGKHNGASAHWTRFQSNI